ncbi:MauE/DoxX family redox-associated membrane protein [Hasllibacter halocynthiae]|nr:MauE/DoxX family redox-associated membrane protein [Hasllibacter halocynthiae]
MTLPDHTCPSGLKARDLLRREGYAIDDRPFLERPEVDAFKRRWNVETTPQIWIDGERVGGYQALRERLGKPVRQKGETSYRPVIAIFAVCALLAAATTWWAAGTLLSVRTAELFVAFAMSVLGIQKLQDIESFSTMFLNYDLLARRWVPYGYVYPFIETGAGILMVAGALIWVAAPLALFAGTIGAISVFKAVYLDKRELKCACVGGNSNVPLGFVSLSENLAMIGMALWMGARALF